METDKVKVEKLMGNENWTQWQFVMKTLLDGDDLLEVCDGTTPKPVAVAGNGEGGATAAALRKWQKANKMAKKLIVTTVGEKPLQFLMNCDTAQEMWQKLHSVYDMKSEESLSLIQKQFFEFRWDPCNTVVEHISKLEQIANKMKKLGAAIPDSMLMTRILSTLPSKFNHFHSAWDSTDVTKRNLENLTTRLLTEEFRLQRSSEDDESETSVAMLLRRERKKERQETKKFKPICFTCGKNHLRKDCEGCFKCGSKFHLKKDCSKDEEFKGVQPIAFIGITVEANKGNDWIIDSGASDHVTNRQDWFNNYQSFSKPLKIWIGNGKAVLAFGRGDIKIETLVEGKWEPAIMYGVLYCPEMMVNLFSVKAVAKKGIDFMIKNNGCKCVFTQGVHQEVVATGIEIDNLYRIQLRVILPKCTSLVSNVESASLQIGHERLCYQQEFLKEQLAEKKTQLEELQLQLRKCEEELAQAMVQVDKEGDLKAQAQKGLKELESQLLGLQKDLEAEKAARSKAERLKRVLNEKLNALKKEFLDSLDTTTAQQEVRKVGASKKEGEKKRKQVERQLVKFQKKLVEVDSVQRQEKVQKLQHHEMENVVQQLEETKNVNPVEVTEMIENITITWSKRQNGKSQKR